MAKKIIAVAGPTASGKTALAVDIAERVGGEVVSCDSMQIYKNMNIGTAKPQKSELRGIPHYMLDFVDPRERYSVADFVKEARSFTDNILERGKIPIFAGGTGLYMDSVLNNIAFADFEGNPQICEELKLFAAEHGNEALHDILKREDSEAASKIHPNNVRRVIRAIEVCRVTGKPFTQVSLEARREPVYDALILGIDVEREVLYERINNRVDKMLEVGLLAEVEQLRESGVGRDTTAMQAIGYKELLDFLENRCSYSEAVEKIKRESRRYAKRQMTWFRRNPDICWVKPSDDGGREEIYEKCFTFLKKSDIL